MPYSIRKKGDEWCVYNKETGENKGCSDSRRNAIAHMRKLYMVSHDTKKQKG